MMNGRLNTADLKTAALERINITRRKATAHRSGGIYAGSGRRTFKQINIAVRL